MSKFRGRRRGGGRGGGGSFRGRGGGSSAGYAASRPKRPFDGASNTALQDEEGTREKLAERFAHISNSADLESQLGFPLLKAGAPPTLGWLINLNQTLIPDSEWPSGKSALDLYFIGEDDHCFRSQITFHPYFFVKCKRGTEGMVEDFLRRKFERTIESMAKVIKEDLDLPNHLNGTKREYLKLTFRNVGDLAQVKKFLLPIAQRNGESFKDGISDGIYDSTTSPLDHSNIDESILEDYAMSFSTTTISPSGTVGGAGAVNNHHFNALSNVVGLREFDLQYHLRVCIDLDLRIGHWYLLNAASSANDSEHLSPAFAVGPASLISIRRHLTKNVRPDPIVLAFDIETSKMPLKFPDAQNDHIMMISYMINGHGFLIVNRDIVGEDIEDFEYTPKPDFPGSFKVVNCCSERTLIEAFFSHIQQVRPHIFVTYNGDFFDWPFIETRASKYSIKMMDQIGVGRNANAINSGSFVSSSGGGAYGKGNNGNDVHFSGRHCVHMDCFAWVKRDSYLPAGSHGLKAVCAMKLGYDPLELDPETMTPLAKEEPQTLASYSVSDAVATYYLYMKYVHPFIFSLCTIIPLQPDEVLRKGTGTLCETLLMAEAYKANVIMKNKHTSSKELFHKGHLLESETYIGGHVEALEAGIYRSDFDYNFQIDPAAVSKLIDEIEAALQFHLYQEIGLKKPSTNDGCTTTNNTNEDWDEILNYSEVKQAIKDQLLSLYPGVEDISRAGLPTKSINTKPLIYHLDVGSMYPNIILSNRLQPTAMVSEPDCAVCDFNKPGKECQRKMDWSWRGEFYTAKSSEYRMIKKQLENERFPLSSGAAAGSKFQKTSSSTMTVEKTSLAYHELSQAEQNSLLRKRLATYSQKVYKRSKVNEVIKKESIVCQRENSFYIDTVRSFRDRRYDYKALQKNWKKKLDASCSAEDPAVHEEAEKMLVLYDSLQLAHKCILNSFYGYVMRKGARWYSMEMGGIVCETGASIITLARELVEKVGRPLELDTDGIWCMLPSLFPQGHTLRLRKHRANGTAIEDAKLSFDYPCVMLNHLVWDKFTNHQYQKLEDPLTRTYSVHSENSIYFEIDGPYRAMVLPSSTEEGRQLKKRYAVFNMDGSLAELKGFEVKRRGELKLIKILQTQIFSSFLDGHTLEECYASVSRVCNYWLDCLMSRGEALEDGELMGLISENRSMSKSLEEYGEQKSTSISTARRLAEFLGDQMVKDAGLACKFIIACAPAGQPVANRAIPVAIFSATPKIREHYLKRWLKDTDLASSESFSLRNIIDWSYYQERISVMIQKLIVIPAYQQNIPNPCPRVTPPPWLVKKLQLSAANSNSHQTNFSHLITKKTSTIDIEDFGSPSNGGVGVGVSVAVSGDSKESTTTTIATKTDPEVDYYAWLKDRFDAWNAIKKPVPEVDTWHNTNLASPTSTIHLVSISKSRTTPTLGMFDLLLSVDGTLTLLTIAFKRRIYCSLKEPPPTNKKGLGERVFKKTVDNSPSKNMVMLEMSESVFQNKFLSALTSGPTSLLRDPNLLSVWEADVPLEWLLMVEIKGLSVRSLADNGDGHNNQNNPRNSTIPFQSLAWKSSISYLKEASYVFVAQMNLLTNNVFVVLDSKTPSNCRLVVCDPRMQRQLPSVKALASLLNEHCCSNGGDSGTIRKVFGAQRYTLEVDLYSSLESFKKSLSIQKDSICLYMHDKNSALLFDDRIGHNVVHCKPFYNPTLPSLDWQRQGSKELLSAVVGRLPSYHDLSIQLCQWAQIPLGLCVALGEKERLSVLSDLFLSRTLRQQGYLLSWNEGLHPVISSPRNAVCASIARTNTTKKINLLQEERTAPSTGAAAGIEREDINTPNLYRRICADIPIGGLAINALLEGHFLGATPADDHMATDAAAHLSSVSTSPILHHIRLLLTQWLKDSFQVEEESLLQDLIRSLVDSLYSWIRNGHSRLLKNSPEILFSLGATMDRSLLYLQKHCQYLGCDIIFSSHSRLILSTMKTSAINARSFLQYLSSSLKDIDGLAWITLGEPVMYSGLLWMNATNYCGLRIKEELAVSGDGFCSGDVSDANASSNNDSSSQEELVSSLGLMEFLPQILRRPFQSLIREYVEWSLKEAWKVDLLSSTSSSSTAVEDGDGDGDDDDLERERKAGCIMDVKEEWKVKVMGMVNEISKALTHTSQSMTAENAMLVEGIKRVPSPLASMGDPKPLRDPGLMFIKYLAALLTLDRRCAPALFRLWKICFSIVGEHAFSDEASIFKDPNGPLDLLVVKGVVCESCWTIGDIDFSRDKSILSNLYGAAGNNLNDNYRKVECSNCSTPYPACLIESELISLLTLSIKKYQEQDLVCRYCRNVKVSLCNPHCSSCFKGDGSGDSWILDPSSSLFERRVLLLKSVAKHLNYGSLEMFVNNL